MSWSGLSLHDIQPVVLPRTSVNLHTYHSCVSSEVSIHFLKILTELVMCVCVHLHIYLLK